MSPCCHRPGGEAERWAYPDAVVTTRCAVLLRGVNVGKHNRIAMADLRALLADVGATDVRTLLQSGNAAVTAAPDGLAEKLEAALAAFGVPVRVLVRTDEDLDGVIAGNPWPDRAEANPKMVHVAFLERPFLDHPAERAVVEAFGLRHGDDELAMGEKDLYLSYATSSFDSPVNKVLPKLSGVASARNWNTLLKLRDLVSG
jgi:uncharacterized protein (DUF1697 family)